MARTFVALALIALAAPAAAGPTLPAPGAAPIYGEARPISAWVKFCGDYPHECPTAGPARVTLDAATWARIGLVNRTVNDQVKPIEDIKHWGVPDRWDLAEDGSGDCEDYALLKRHLLVGAGMPAGALRVTVVIDEHKEGHAVLSVLTDKGDMVLDNRERRVLAWNRTGYTFVKREGADGLWEALAPTYAVPAPAVASAPHVAPPVTASR